MPSPQKPFGLDDLGCPNYAVTRDGRVYSITSGKFVRLKPFPHSKSGRPTVEVWDREGRRRKYALARLILTAFGRPSPGGRGYEPRHKNGDITDCRLANLEWAKKREPSREQTIELIRSLIARYRITPEELS